MPADALFFVLSIGRSASAAAESMLPRIDEIRSSFAEALQSDGNVQARCASFLSVGGMRWCPAGVAATVRAAVHVAMQLRATNESVGLEAALTAILNNEYAPRRAVRVIWCADQRSRGVS